MKGAVEARFGSLALTVAVPSSRQVVAYSEFIFGRDFLAGELESVWEIPASPEKHTSAGRAKSREVVS